MSAMLELLRSHNIEQAYHDLQTRLQVVGEERFTGIADTNQVTELYCGNPSDSGVDILLSTTIDTGGLAYLNVTDGASIDTSGTTLDTQTKGTGDTADANLVAEYGGTYSTAGTTLNGVAPGSQRTGGPATSNGASESADVRLLQPGDAIVFEAINQSGGAADFSVGASAVEIDR